MAGTVENVTDENYEELKGAQATVVAYGIAACEPCAAYDPILEEVAANCPTFAWEKPRCTYRAGAGESKSNTSLKRTPPPISIRAGISC